MRIADALEPTVIDDLSGSTAKRRSMTEDGGYCLVGASAAHPGLLDAAPLGTSSAYDALCANARTRGLSVAAARVWYDVDVAADLLRLAADLRVEPARAPRTAALLASWDGTARAARSSERGMRRPGTAGGTP